MYQIIFKDGKIKDISDEQGIKLLEAFCQGKEKFILNKALQSFSSVKDISPAIKDNDGCTKLPKTRIAQWPKKKKFNALSCLKKGFLRGVNDMYNLKPRQSEVLRKIETAIEKCGCGPELQEPITTVANLSQP